jgi:hypothetical protein
MHQNGSLEKEANRSMTTKHLRGFSVFITTLALTSSSGCRSGDGNAQQLNFLLWSNMMPERLASFERLLAEESGCFLKRHFQPSARLVSNQIDFLLIVDLTESIRIDNDKILACLDRLIASLPEGADLNIGVMHGQGQRGPVSGRLFKHRSGPYVLKTQAHSRSQIQAHLKTKIL